MDEKIFKKAADKYIDAGDKTVRYIKQNKKTVDGIIITTLVFGTIGKIAAYAIDNKTISKISRKMIGASIIGMFGSGIISSITEEEEKED